MIRHPDRLFIGGQWVLPSSRAAFDVITPSTEELFIRIAEAREPDIERAVAAAREAFDRGPWPRLTHRERAAFLSAAGAGIVERGPELGEIWTREVGIIRQAAVVMAPRAGEAYDYYAALADRFEFEERHPRAAGRVGLLVREPVGVVAAIIPWNAPLMLMSYKVAPALLAGCAVIVKASPEAPGAAYVMAEIMESIGLPPGVFNVVTADRAVSESLVRHRGVDKVSFTGSCAAGKRIAALCGERIARCTLELGGKSAALILDDYDPALAARTIAATAPHITGQVCFSLTRVIASRARYGAVVDALTAAFAAIRVGDPFDAASQMGPLATARQRERVEGYIARGRAEGARLTVGGGRPRHLSRGYYVEPTVFADVDNAMVIAREEIFGPVISVIEADNETRAIEIANDSDFGLNASVFTNDPERAYRIARKLQSGTVGHNAMSADFGIAFGGFKQSGIGREGGREGLLPFLEAKTILLDREPAHLAGAR